MIKEAVAQFRKSIQKLNLIQTCDLLLQGFEYFLMLILFWHPNLKIQFIFHKSILLYGYPKFI